MQNVTLEQNTLKTKIYSEFEIEKNLDISLFPKNEHLNTSEQKHIESSSDIDKCIKELAEIGFCNSAAVLKNQKEKDIKLEDIEFQPLKQFLQKPIHLFCDKSPKDSKGPVEKSDLEITFTIEEIFEVYGYDPEKKCDNFTQIGSSVLHFLGGVFIRRYLKSAIIDDKGTTLIDVIPKDFLIKRIDELSKKPADYDFRIDIEDCSFLPMDKELNKLIEFLAKKMEDNKKCKIWGQKIFKKHKGCSLDINDPTFWFKFIDQLAFIKKWHAPHDYHLQYAMVRFMSNEGDNIEIIIKKKLPRLAIYSQSAFECSILNQKLFVREIENTFNYSTHQCLYDEIFKILRKMQTNWKVRNREINFYDEKDWEIYLSKLLKGYSSYELIEEEKFLAVQYVNTKEKLPEAIISLLDDAIINHQENKPEAYISLLINAYNSFERTLHESAIKKIHSHVCGKISKIKLSKHSIALKAMLEKISIPETISYLQLMGFLDLSFCEKDKSIFKTINHEGKIYLQILLQDHLLIPFDLKKSLELLIKNPKIIENFNIINVFTDTHLFDVKYCRLPNVRTLISSCEKEINQLVKLLGETKQKHAKLLISLLEYLPWRNHAFEKFSLTMKTLPSIKEAYDIFPILTPHLKNFPYELSDQQILNLKNAIHKGSDVDKWKAWIFTLDSISTLRDVSKECIHHFLTNKELQKGIKLKGGFVEPLVNLWEDEERFDDIIVFLRRPDVKILYTPWERLSFLLTAYKKSGKYVNDILEKCEEDSISKNIQIMTDEDAVTFKHICLFLIENGQINKTETILRLIILKNASLWPEIFSHLLKIAFNDEIDSNISLQQVVIWWKKIKTSSKDIYIQSGIKLLENIQHHQSEESNFWLMNILDALQEQELTENSKKLLAPFIIKTLSQKILTVNSKNDSILNEISTLRIESSKKFNLHLQLLQRYAAIKDQTCFCQLYEEMLIEYPQLSVSSPDLIKLFNQQFQLISHLQRRKIIAITSKTSVEWIYHLVDEHVKKETNLSRQEDLILSLEKNDLFFFHLDLWLNILLKSLNPLSISTGLKQFLKGYINEILFSMLKKNNHLEAVNIILFCQSCDINIKLNAKYIVSLTRSLFEDISSIEIQKLDLLSSFLNRHSNDSSAKESVLFLNKYLLNFYCENDLLEAGKNIIDRILIIYPEKIASEPSFFSMWSSKIKYSQHPELRKEWFLIIKNKEIWLTDLLDYSQFVYQQSGHQQYLKIIQEILVNIKDEKVIDHLSRMIQHHIEIKKECAEDILDWMKCLESQSIYHVSIWKTIFAVSMMTTNQVLFKKSCHQLQYNLNLRDQWLSNISELSFAMDPFINNLVEQDVDTFIFFTDKILPKLPLSKYSEKHLLTIFHTLIRLYHNSSLPLSVISFIELLMNRVDEEIKSYISLCLNVCFKSDNAHEDRLKIILFFLENTVKKMPSNFLQLARENTYNFLIQEAIYYNKWSETLFKIMEHVNLEEFLSNTKHKKNVEAIYIARQFFMLASKTVGVSWRNTTECLLKQLLACIKEAETFWISKALHFFCDNWIIHFLSSSKEELFLNNNFDLISTVVSYVKDSSICTIFLDALLKKYMEDQTIQEWLIADFFKLAMTMIARMPEKKLQEIYLEKLFISQFSSESCYLSFLYEAGFPCIELTSFPFNLTVDYFKNILFLPGDVALDLLKQKQFHAKLSSVASYYLLEIGTVFSVRKAMEIYHDNSLDILTYCQDWDYFFLKLIEYFYENAEKEVSLNSIIKLSLLFEDLVKNVNSLSSSNKSIEIPNNLILRALEVAKKVFSFYLSCNKVTRDKIPDLSYLSLCHSSYKTVINTAPHIKPWITNSKTLIEISYLISSLLIDFLDLTLLKKTKKDNISSSTKKQPLLFIYTFDIVGFMDNLEILHVQLDPMMLPMINAPHLFKDLKVLYKDQTVVQQEKKKLKNILINGQTELTERKKIILSLYKKICEVVNFYKKIGYDNHDGIERWAKAIKVKSVKMQILNEMDF